MPRFSLTSRCRVCGKEIGQSGPARAWVHLNEFYAKADHAPEPRENNPYMTPKRTPEPEPAKATPAEDAKAKSKPRSLADLRRRLQAPGDDAGRKPVRRPVAQAPDGKELDVDEAARRLRRLRYAPPDDD